ncbi:MAG: pepsin/retropepsin-like aspartic protease family protein [Rikenellaceae bacterium]|nr:pepsin/retropepsin-like aspartic protease family protein [Rikenellaceae bacterium]MCL2691906.1 pepsin/retropepsin-like aspartic protease family protein [Rikenellaceae bacterium]
MNIRRIWLSAAAVVLVAVGMAGAANAQTQMVHDTIPFEIIQNKFVFEARIDGKPARFILDTGGQNIIMAEHVEHYGIDLIKSQAILDVNDARTQAWLGAAKDFRIGKWMVWNPGRILVVPNNQFFRDLGVVGTVGGDFFSGVCLTIDRRNRRFMISHPYRPAGIPRDAGTPMNMGSTFHAVVPVSVGSEKTDILFDTGKSGFLALSADDFEKLSAARQDNVEKRETGFGLLYVGVGGIEGAIVDTVHKVNVPVITLPGGHELHNVGSLVGRHPATIFGQEIFEHGIVMLDYPRGLFYFFPYEEGPTDVAMETRAWNVRILPFMDDGRGVFTVVMTVGDVDLSIGDRVWSIDGVDLAQERPAEDVILILLEGRDTAAIMVGDAPERLREVIIRKI